MRILYLSQDHGIPVLGPKGAAVHVRQMIAAFARAGHSVTLATPVVSKTEDEPAPTVDAELWHIPVDGEARAAGIALKHFNDDARRRRTRLPAQMRGILYNRQLRAGARPVGWSEEPHDLVYERVSLYGVAGAKAVLAARASARRGAQRAAGPRARHLPRQRARRAGRAGRALDTCAGPTRSSRSRPPLRDHLLAHGLDPAASTSSRTGSTPSSSSRARPTTRRARPLRRWVPGRVLGFVGGLRPWHGVEALPDAAGSRSSPGIPELRLLVVGDGPLRGRLADDLARRGLERNAVFTGSRAARGDPALLRASTGPRAVPAARPPLVRLAAQALRVHGVRRARRRRRPRADGRNRARRRERPALRPPATSARWPRPASGSSPTPPSGAAWARRRPRTIPEPLHVGRQRARRRGACPGSVPARKRAR